MVLCYKLSSHIRFLNSPNKRVNGRSSYMVIQVVSVHADQLQIT